MKKITILMFLPVLVFMGCKKSHTCVCGTAEKTPVFEMKGSKKEARDKCSDYEYETTHNPLIDMVDGWGCEIK